jgi:hypothetical protein
MSNDAIAISVDNTNSDKETLKSFSKEIVSYLKDRNLPIWQAKEVLVYANNEIERQMLR